MGDDAPPCRFWGFLCWAQLDYVGNINLLSFQTDHLQKGGKVLPCLADEGAALLFLITAGGFANHHQQRGFGTLTKDDGLFR